MSTSTLAAPAAGAPVTRRATGPKAGQSLFYVRATKLRYQWDPTFVRNGRVVGRFVELKTNNLGNKPLLAVYAYDQAGAENAAKNFIREQVAAMEAKGFQQNWTQEEGEEPVFHGWRRECRENDGCIYSNLFNIYVTASCRRCKGTGYKEGMQHVYSARCFQCGGSGNEETPIDVRTRQPIENKSGVDPATLGVKVSQAKRPEQVEARRALVMPVPDESDPFEE